MGAPGLGSQTGSLHKASIKLGMSYSKAMRMLKGAEHERGLSLLDRRIGGADGGGSELTPDGRRVVAEFVAMRFEAYDHLNGLFEKHFSGEPFARRREGT